MSEVDRLGNSGPPPALPIGDKHRGKNDSGGKPVPDPDGNHSDPHGDGSEPNARRPPKSIIDEYA